MQTLDSWRDEVIYVPVIPCEDEPVHTPEHPFCADPSCGCHQDDELIEQYLLRPQNAGLLTMKEAYRIFFDMQV